MSGALDPTTAAYRERLDWRNPQARLLLADLADACNFGRTSHVPGDAQATAFNEGKRAVWLYVQGRLELPLVLERD